jgi:hypothetical protein
MGLARDYERRAGALPRLTIAWPPCPPACTAAAPPYRDIATDAATGDHGKCPGAAVPVSLSVSNQDVGSPALGPVLQL